MLYDEPHPYGDEIGAMCAGDVGRKPDLLIVMGTSLKVHGIKKLVKDLAKAVHAHPSAASPKNKTGGGKVVFVNKTAPAAEWNGIIDVHVAGETDAWVDRVVCDWKKSRPADWEVQQTLDATGSDDPFALAKTVAGKAASACASVARPLASKLTAAAEPKQKKGNAENIPPLALKGKPSLAAPVSPSKRRANGDADGSPRKKRLQVVVELPIIERGLLFGASNVVHAS